MKYYNRENILTEERDGLDELLRRLYANRFGRLLVRQLTNRHISALAGRMMDHPFSKRLIPGFIRRYDIDMGLYECRRFASYNDFFTRKTASGIREMSEDPADFCAPCDGRLTVVRLTPQARLSVKGTDYDLASILRYRSVARRFEGGTALIFRLSVDDYHRYAYNDDAIQLASYEIPGRYYSVSPAVLEREAVFKENTRTWCSLDTAHFGHMLQMEVGATMVGRIVNHRRQGVVQRGEEKGYFEFGGSTVILFLMKHQVELLPQYTDRAHEVAVRMGDVIGRSVRSSR